MFIHYTYTYLSLSIYIYIYIGIYIYMYTYMLCTLIMHICPYLVINIKLSSCLAHCSIARQSIVSILRGTPAGREAWGAARKRDTMHDHA